MSAPAQAPARLAARAGLGGDWARQGADSLAAALKIVSDLTAQEVALLVGMLRERMTTRPGASAVGAAGRVVAGMADAGKVLLDLAAGETAIVVDGVKEAMRLPPNAAAMVDLIPRGIATVIELQKDLLEAIAGQIEGLTESYAEGKPLDARGRAMKAARQAVERFIASQKTFLDQVAEQVILATEGGKPSRATRPDRSTVLIQLSREGIEKFIEAQSEVLELAMERMEKSGGHPHNKPGPGMSVAELTRRSVVNFTTAQKSLLDLALRATPAPAEERPVAPRRRPRPRKRATAATA